MESLIDNLNSLSINGKKTGLVYHEKTLLHSPDPKKHEENPKRLESILSHLSAKKLLTNPNIDLQTNFSPSTDEIILTCHSESYIERIKDIFPEESTKKSIFIFDSYFNRFTNIAARLAVSSLIISVDKIFEGLWKNAFALARPPGHHSGEKSNINGFCVFNNVAIAAKYAKNKYNLKRIVIFDWDIHHGDGTQHIFYKDSSVLFCSIHRYDNGLFYPRGEGSSENIGEGEGKGFNINIAWNTHPEADNDISISNDEYIYAFERLIFPIFKEFDPELIFVSCGFDSCKGDPLGDIELERDGYAYMLRRLQELANGKIILALEGGYNLKCLENCSETVLRVLLNENIPTANSINNLNMEEMKKNCKTNIFGFETVLSCCNHIKKYWEKCLMQNELTIYEDNILNNLINVPKYDNYIIDGETILKLKRGEESLFYEKCNKEKILDEFLPKFYGIKNNNNLDYLILENFLKNKDKSSFLIIKIGDSKGNVNENLETIYLKKILNSKSTSLSLGFRISEGKIFTKDNQLNIIRNECLKNYFNENYVKEILKKFMDNDKKNIDNLLNKFEKLIDSLNMLNIFNFNSITLILVNYNKEINLSVINFENCRNALKKDKIDEKIMFGLKNLKEFLNNIK